MGLRQKIESRMIELKNWMESNHHLINKEEVYQLTLNISKFWSVLSEEDREYIQAARYAIDKGIEWRIGYKHM